MPVEQGAGMAEEIENVGLGHSVLEKEHISLHRLRAVKCAATLTAEEDSFMACRTRVPWLS